MGLKDTRHIGRIVIDPTDANIVYVAAVGHLWGPNAERGVFKTTDGGATWTKVLYVDENTGATDLVMDPQDPQTLFAATYQRQRKAWGFNGGGPGSGIYRTHDGGATWTKLTNGLPAGRQGTHRPRRLPARRRDRLRDGRGAGADNGVYRSARSRRDVGADVHAQHAADVLQPDPRSTRTTRPRLHARLEPRLLHLRRRRARLPRRVQHGALRGPRAVDRSRRHAIT